MAIFSTTVYAAAVIKPAENKALAYSMAEAIAAYKSMQYSRSLVLFKELTERTPKDPLAWLYFGQSLIKSNEPQQARKAFEAVLELQQSGAQAEAARRMLDAMPSIDLYSLRIDSALTLGDWLVLARKDIAEGRLPLVLAKLHDLPATMQTLPQVEALQNQVFEQLLAGLVVDDEITALHALEQIDALKLKTFGHGEVSRIEARACHFLGRYSCAEAAYASWLNQSAHDHPLRNEIVEALLQSRNQQAPTLFHYLTTLGAVVKEIPSTGEVAEPVSRIMISHVQRRGPAEYGGMQVNDILTQVGTVPVRAFSDLISAVNVLTTSGELRVKLWRPILKRELTLSLPRRPLNEDDGLREFAFKLADEGNLSRANGLLSELVIADPGDDTAWHYLGQVLSKSNDIIGARRAFYRCIEASPKGKFAESAKKSLAELPVPDVYTIQLDSGLTLGDWLASLNNQRDSTMRTSLIKEIGEHIEKLGPIPELLSLNSKIRAELVEDADRRLKEFIATIVLDSQESAQSALSSIVAAREITPSNRSLIRLHGRACHLLEDFACAERMYSLWLQSSPGSDALRPAVVAGLRLVRERQAVQDIPRMFGELAPACAQCPVMVQISGGVAETVGNDGRRGLIEVAPYQIAKTEVTQGLWKSVMGRNPSQFQTCGDSCPVENVSWDDAKEFIRRLNLNTGLKFRLPTETEWEVACRAGGEYDYCGVGMLDELAWYGAYSGNGGTSGKSTHPVAKRKANGWGVYDMNGNVKEWVEDGWRDEVTTPDALSARGNRRVLRGGSWASKASQVNASYREWDGQNERYPFNGFRLALSE